jgi:hypothetical protein
MTESTLKDNATAAKKLLGAAAQLGQKQAALANLNNVTLTKIYHAIGKRILGHPNLPPDLVPHRDKIRSLEAGIAGAPDVASTKDEPASGFAGQAKVFAQQAAKKTAKAAADATASVKIQTALVALGKDAVEKYGDDVVPPDLRSQLAEVYATRAQLESEVRELKTAATNALPALSLVGAGGTLLYLAAWVLPAERLAGSGASAFVHALNGSWLQCFSALTNSIAVVAIVVLFFWRTSDVRSLAWLRKLLIASMLLNCMWLVGLRQLMIGYYLWQLSFAALAVAFLRLEHEASNAVPVKLPYLGTATRAGMLRAAAGLAVLVLAVDWLAMSASRLMWPPEPSEDYEVASAPADAQESEPQAGNSREDAAVEAMWKMVPFFIGREMSMAYQQQAFRAGQQAYAAQQGYGQGGLSMPATPRPPAVEWWEGRCSRCGWGTGRRSVRDNSMRCRQRYPSGECGGVIMWTRSDY